ncbi:MAG: UDP-N-acetylmuramate dehydrogenase [Thermodesulfobacteriota bacterium]
MMAAARHRAMAANGAERRAALVELLAACCPGCRIAVDEPLAPYTTFRVGGPAWAVVEPVSAASLAALVTGLGERQIPWWILGRGSNVLVADGGLAGVAIVLGRDFAAITPVAGQRHQLRVQAGCSLARLLRYCQEHGLGGLEFAAGIPGTVGGAVKMNAGAWGREIGALVTELTVMDSQGGCATIAAVQAGFAYRQSIGLGGRIVVEAVLEFTPRSRELIDAECQAAISGRLERQPLQVASAGSFFRNPAGHAAGRLIEQAGLKGLAVGGAMVSEKHANFIVNTGTATCGDILDLMRLVQKKVYLQTGIMLEPEVHLLGPAGEGGG